MEKIADTKKLEHAKIDDEDMEQDEVYISDTSTKEEEKGEQLIAGASTKIQNDDLGEEKSDITMILLVHDDINGDPQVEVSLQKSKLETSLSIPLATSFEEPQQQ